MSDARQIAEKAARERLSMVFNDYAQRTDTMLYSALVALLSGAYHEELIKGERHTVALEAKERVLDMCKQDGQRWKEERDTYKAQLDEAVRLLERVRVCQGDLHSDVQAFLSTLNGPKP